MRFFGLERLHLSRSGCRSAIVAPRRLKPRGSVRFAHRRICGNRHTMPVTALGCLATWQINTIGRGAAARLHSAAEMHGDVTSDETTFQSDRSG